MKRERRSIKRNWKKQKKIRNVIMCLKEKSFVEIVALPWGVVSANITLRVTTAQITGRMVQWDV